MTPPPPARSAPSPDPVHLDEIRTLPAYAPDDAQARLDAEHDKAATLVRNLPLP